MSASPNAAWYETVSGDALEPGDMLSDCPLPFLVSLSDTEDDDAVVGIDTLDVVILSQSCYSARSFDSARNILAKFMAKNCVA